MQIGISSTLPAQNLHILQARRASFQFQKSPLNPLTRSSSSCQKPVCSSASTTELTRKHLSNLEKLLQKSTQSDPEPVIKAPSKNSMDQPKTKARTFARRA
ncbi:putative triacylglycerol lipase [Corchorus olitorius]|uniref:Triacylglycerol lipase n=1 Tax=Corchorus olitorius TaxID=93759 RepID=A0A1R3L075_9ROSI|nr:putative triacylglycerol lipase [Corchorus olitorius]